MVTRFPPLLVAPDEEPSRVRSRGPLGASVLVIDDVAEARELSAAWLDLRGFRCTLAEDGPSGLAIAQDEVPDVILLDFSMPGMDGAEVVRRLGADERTRGIPIVMLTAILEAVPTATRAAVAACIGKPCDPDRLVDVIAQAVDVPRARCSGS